MFEIDLARASRKDVLFKGLNTVVVTKWRRERIVRRRQATHQRHSMTKLLVAGFDLVEQAEHQALVLQQVPSS